MTSMSATPLCSTWWQRALCLPRGFRCVVCTPVPEEWMLGRCHLVYDSSDLGMFVAVFPCEARVTCKWTSSYTGLSLFFGKKNCCACMCGHTYCGAWVGLQNKFMDFFFIPPWSGCRGHSPVLCLPGLAFLVDHCWYNRPSCPILLPTVGIMNPIVG